MELINEKDCTGCMACYSACPENAIKITESKKGFYIPIIDKQKCIECGKCKNTCPQINKVLKMNEKRNVKACWSKNDNIRWQSTSGGISTEIAIHIIENNGVVFGAIYDKSFKVHHCCIDNKEDLSKLRGSKYVQSYIGDTYKEVKKYLDENRNVLFTGTSCQIAGLKNFLSKEYDNLITVDILCHGVPSPKIFQEYLINKKAEGNISDIKFRYKKPSWTVFSMRIEYENGKIYQKSTFEDQFIRGFLYDYITNEACEKCNYTGTERISDITIADFWGYISEERKYRNTEKGISLAILNTEKGSKIFDNIKNNLEYTEKNINEAKLGNQCLREPFKKNEKYNEFWNDYFQKGYDYVSEKYFTVSKQQIKRKISRLFNDNAYVFPKKLRYKLIEIRTKSK